MYHDNSIIFPQNSLFPNVDVGFMTISLRTMDRANMSEKIETFKLLNPQTGEPTGTT